MYEYPDCKVVDFFLLTSFERAAALFLFILLLFGIVNQQINSFTQQQYVLNINMSDR